MNVRSLILKVLPAALFLVLFLSFVHWSKESSPNRADAKLKELQHLASEMTVPSSFREVATHSSSRDMDAGVYKSYHSSASFEEVKKFYSDQLIARGYRIYGEPVEWDGLVLYSEHLLKDYGIELVRVAGCVVDEALVERSRGYNETSLPIIESRFGEGILESVHQRAVAEWQKSIKGYSSYSRRHPHKRLQLTAR